MFFMRLNSQIEFDVPAKARSRRRRVNRQACQVHCLYWAHLRRLSFKVCCHTRPLNKVFTKLAYIHTSMMKRNGGIKMHTK